MSIVEQAMEQMEPGDIAAKTRRLTRPPKGEVYQRTESPRGDFAVFLVSDGSQYPYRVKVRAPSFANLQPSNQCSATPTSPTPSSSSAPSTSSSAR